MKKQFILLLFLVVSVTAGFSKPSATTDSIIKAFVAEVESKVVLDTQYVHPTDKDSIWSSIHDQYRSFEKLPSYYSEGYCEDKYLVEITKYKNTSKYQILIYDRKEFSIIQCSFRIKANHLVAGSVIFGMRNNDTSYAYVYDPKGSLSRVKLKLWSQEWVTQKNLSTVKGPEEPITIAELEKQLRNLLE